MDVDQDLDRDIRIQVSHCHRTIARMNRHRIIRTAAVVLERLVIWICAALDKTSPSETEGMFSVVTLLVLALLIWIRCFPALLPLAFAVWILDAPMLAQFALTFDTSAAVYLALRDVAMRARSTCPVSLEPLLMCFSPADDRPLYYIRYSLPSLFSVLPIKFPCRTLMRYPANVTLVTLHNRGRTF
jgi:hypothetical protein